METYSSLSRADHSGDNSARLGFGVMDGSPHITYLLLLLVSCSSQCELGCEKIVDKNAKGRVTWKWNPNTEPRTLIDLGEPV